MKYNMAVLDFDGTLADTLPFVLGIADHLSEKYHLAKMDKRDIDSLKSQNAAELMKKHNVPAWKLPLLAAEVQRLMHQNIDEIRLFPGMVDVLQALHATGVRIAVVTSNAMKNIEKVLDGETLSLVSRFECGVSLFGKSDKLFKLMRKYQLSGQKVISIGDELRDIEAARKAGVDCAAVTWGYASREALKAGNPDYLLDEVKQIVEILA